MPEDRRRNMGRKSPQTFIKRQKEMERAKKAREKMAKRQQKKEDVVAVIESFGISGEPITNEA